MSKRVRDCGGECTEPEKKSRALFNDDQTFYRNECKETIGWVPLTPAILSMTTGIPLIHDGVWFLNTLDTPVGCTY